jgi:hypothetical protein
MANSADALAVFESKRKPCHAGAHVRKLDRNTYLEWLDDDLLLLRLHQTYIARYVPHGVILNFDGWRTNVTFERAERFTPLRTFAMNGLHFIVPAHTSSAYKNANVLFTDGITLHCDGTVAGAPLPTAHAQIIDTVTNFPKRVRRWCERSVRAWDDFRFAEDGPDCCVAHDTHAGNAAFLRHVLAHIDDGSPAPCDNLDQWASRALALQGDELCKALSTKLYRTVREQMVRTRLATIDESFAWLPPGKSSNKRVGASWRDPFQ